MAKLLNRKAIITGAAGGIGGEIAREFVREGADVALLDKDVAGAQALSDELQKDGKTVPVIEVDVRDEESINDAIASAIEKLGTVDILVNCAGIDTASNVVDMPTAMWDEMLNINLRSIFLCTRKALPTMIAKGFGRIINISSQLGHKGAAQMAHYAAAKAGVIGFTRSLAYEVAKQGITVNAICPGPIDTELFRALPEEWRKNKLAELPIGRAGRVDEIAPAAVLLASDKGSYFIGSTINPNGGDYMI